MIYPCLAGSANRDKTGKKSDPVFLMLRALRFSLLFVVLLSSPCIFSGCSTGSLNEKKMSAQGIDNAEEKLKDESWQIRMTAVQELSNYLPGSYNYRVSNLLVHASKDPHDQVRIETVNSFMKKPSPLFRQRLIEMTDDPSSNVKWFALVALSAYGDPEAAPVFINGLSNEDWLIREASITGLLKIKDASIQEETVPCILLAINDRNVSVRNAALENLRIKDRRLYQGISSQLMKNLKKGPSTLLPILKALNGYILDRDVKGQIIALLTHNNRDIRLLALQILKEDEVLRKNAKGKRKTD